MDWVLLTLAGYIAMFIAGRKSVKDRIQSIDNETDYYVDIHIDPNSKVMTITNIEPKK